ncbi:transporter substrate-binding domain-containing protein [Nocardia cyriacigeorgica]|uniref:Transporter substrate-binding domain-containing protein n=1 Tax=Nocardia cyriacigeorgica TaxID=135487 RepID=A0A6P1D2T9_9NOCA|nr:transporter substrate-binding domain-containing protein [Nocardia cyriacigeorgica]NEW38951.1 transporter substrate-binding domain-containing protein [Nocardia cyriacigeorgica]NEW43761.1 transporter substrate-binding domain-containing protein [Nocardia cyriacigeorgica]NEW50322.1 transporter substrate-binding domain-containing protein [Nocardia cyriacigeorgica]NEW54938.1 transporter substrate-binding domain-containing protein [Nocardia cyriacigeorgica]
MTEAWSRRRFLSASAVGVGLLAAPGLIGCDAVGLGNTLDKITEAGVVKVGYAGERPYAYDDNGLVGAIPAVDRAVFERIGVGRLEGVLVPFRSLIGGVNSGAFDVISAGMFVNKARCEQIAFSEPIYCAQSGLLVRKENPKGLSDFASVARADATVAVLASAVEQSYAQAAGVRDEQIHVVGGQDEGLEQVALGHSDAFALTSISLRTMLEQARQAGPGGPDGGPAEWAAEVELLPPFTAVVDGRRQLGCGAAGFRKTDGSLRDAYNRELAVLRAEGRILELTAPYGFTAAEIPEPSVRTEDLCTIDSGGGSVRGPLPR